MENNQIQKVHTVQGLLSQDNIKNKFSEVLGSKAPGFISSIISAVNSNPALKLADPITVISAAAIAATLDLPINQNLGFAYIIPYKNKGVNQAQFQIGYKGLVQLALRSGQYKTINVTEIYEGQLVEENPFTGIHTFQKAKKSENIIGYLAYFQLNNGFEKMLYWDTEQVKKHAGKYSQSFKSQYGRWKEDFESMAKKTVLKNLLSKFGLLSIEMQRAVISDQSVTKSVEQSQNFDDIDFVYPDNSNVPEIDVESINPIKR